MDQPTRNRLIAQIMGSGATWRKGNARAQAESLLDSLIPEIANALQEDSEAVLLPHLRLTEPLDPHDILPWDAPEPPKKVGPRSPARAARRSTRPAAQS